MHNECTAEEVILMEIFYVREHEIGNKIIGQVNETSQYGE